MTLGEERDLEKIKDCLSYVLADKHSDTPHWDAAYPWKVSPAILPDNRRAVEATFHNTEARLAREPVWKVAYGEQIREMISRGAAIELTKEEIKRWNGPIWYISHLVAPNPHSTSTPVRIVWNSSQEFKGLSLNNLLYKGPDVLNPIRGVLLRFRSRLYAALGDVKKMYNSVWLKDEEVHLHRFLWRDNPEDEIGVFAFHTSVVFLLLLIITVPLSFLFAPSFPRCLIFFLLFIVAYFFSFALGFGFSVLTFPLGLL